MAHRVVLSYADSLRLARLERATKTIVTGGLLSRIRRRLVRW